MNPPLFLLTPKQFKALKTAKGNYEQLAEQTQQAAGFIKQIEEGNFQTTTLEEVLQTTADRKENVLISALISMQQRMQLIAQQEQERKWITEGIASFADILRDKNKYESRIYDVLLSHLVKYIGANQASLFVVQKPADATSPAQCTLDMVSCYAYDRKKHQSKSVLAGQGLVGQCYLEAESIFLTAIPPEYITITSGLGLATPRTLLIVPLKINEQVMGVVELASFQVLKPYQISFVEKLGESIASAIADTQGNDHTRQLLEQMREQTEELRAAEEEMRQNMEEMAATQEEVRRREAEAQNLLLAFRTVSDTYASIEFDMNGYVQEANANFLQTMGYTLAEIKGKHHHTFVEAAYRQTPEYENFWHDLQSGKAFTGQVVRYRKDKQPVWMQVSYAPVSNSSGQYYKVVKLATDITAQKQLEKDAQQQLEELKAQEEELRQNMEELSASQEEIARQSMELQGLSAAVNTTLATIEFSPQGKILTANDNFLKLMGYQLSELRGKHHQLFIDAEYGKSEDYIQFWDELRAGKAQIGQVPRLTKTNQMVWLSASYTPVLDQSGHVIRVIKFAQDITAQKQQAIDFEGQLKSIHQSFAVIEFTAEGKILTANQNFLDAMGYSLDQIQGQHHRIFVNAQQAHSAEYSQFWQQLAEGRFISGEFNRMDKNGKTIRIKGSYNPIVDMNGQVWKVVKYCQLLA